MKKYIPNPVDVSGISLSAGLEELGEVIAENTHEVWSQARTEEGWAYGPKRDDDLKQTPCLVPYEDLPDSEKEYDRIISANVLKLIIKLGYDIKKIEDK